MPIRIRCRNKPLDRQKTIGYKGINNPSESNPKARYVDESNYFGAALRCVGR